MCEPSLAFNYKAGTMLQSISRLSLMTVAVAAVACGPFSRNSTPESVVIFNNESLNQADVYAVRTGGPEFRIGTVSSNRREALRVPSAITSGGGSVTIAARTLASNRTARTAPLTLLTGDTLEVTLPTNESVLNVLPPRTP
jgi:hypothetical protein